MRSQFLGVTAICVMALTMSTSAHHSHANYEIAQFTFLEGVVTQVHLMNPHSWIYLQVPDDKGVLKTWALEATGPRGLERRGIQKDWVKVGDRIKARCHALRDGTRGCLLGFLTPVHGDATRGDGMEIEWD